MAKIKYESIIILSLSLFIVWSAIFIFNLSFIAMDGKRHVSLADDAMISMRYAWNLSHGSGLVWNQGERIEGYSNLLMTLLMAVLTGLFDKGTAVLSIQILGIPTVILCAWTASKVAGMLFEDHEHNRVITVLSFIGVLFYYPLAHWTLIGMETGLSTLLVLLGVASALKWLQIKDSKFLYGVGISFGLAFLTRNDLLLLSIPIFAYLYYEVWKNRKTEKVFPQLFFATIIFGIFVIGQVTFRFVYYGDILPNTYYLKVSRIPLFIRFNDGLLYLIYIVRSSLILLVLASTNLFFKFSLKKAALFSLPVISLLYQVWTGGDAYPHWRFSIPAMPILIVLASGAIIRLSSLISRTIKRSSKLRDVTALSLLLIIILLPFRQVLGFQDAITQSTNNKNNMDTVIAITELTAPEATIGVFTAGLIPYYSGRYAIDFLGKCDPYVARTYPHLPKKIKWLTGITTPGHNKYDLAYSIKKLQPDFVQRFYWAQANVRNFGVERYIKVEYQGENGTKTIHLKNDSPYIYPEKGKFVPWKK